MNQIIAKIGVRAAYEVARELYGSHDEAVQACATQLCMPPEAVEDSLKPETLHE